MVIIKVYIICQCLRQANYNHYVLWGRNHFVDITTKNNVNFYILNYLKKS